MESFQRSLGCLWLRVSLLLLALPALRLEAADEVLRTPPAGYAALQPLVTPLAEAVKNEPTELEKGFPGITLLDEQLDAVAENGCALHVSQVVRKALSDAGAHSDADETFVYRRHDQQFHVLVAESIEPDGTVQAVKPEAILVNSPQRQAQYALYDDQVEVRVIFPNVKPGTLTHFIVARQDLRARMPGEYTRTFEWSGVWPRSRVHRVADLPPGLAARLRVQTLDLDLHAVKIEKRPDGHVRYSLVRTNVPPLIDLANPAPPEQAGPCLHLSTIREWGDIARWYGGLLQDRNRLSPALAAQVEAWTKEAASPAATVAILYDKVANDVRYTGLELGESDYQPHECNAVWDNQYGDCKDKANLLVAFLRQKGIPAYVTLVNASDLGLVDRRVPDFQAFTHAIVALPDDRGGYQFCDPTIARGRPSLLAPSDADRDVLVLTGASDGWVHTPAQGAGQLAFRFALELKASGELAGWLTLTADGFYGAAEDESFHRLDKMETRQSLGALVRGFYPGAQVIDVLNQPRANPAEPFSIKAYVVVPRRLERGSGDQTLTFPRTKEFVDFLGFTPARKSTFFLYRGRTVVATEVRLPAGLAPNELPPSYEVATSAGSIRARWQAAAGTCSAELTLDNSQSVLSPEEFKDYYDGVQGVEAWLDKPVLLTLGAHRPQPADGAALLTDFPQMPSGEGQLALLDERYPDSGNLLLRRAALAKAVEYFPSDKLVAFKAGVYLANLDARTGQRPAALARLAVLLSAYKADVSPVNYGWGRWVYALALQADGQSAKAAALDVELAGDASLSDWVRSRCALTAAELLRAGSPDQAVAVLRPALGLRTDSQPELYALLGRVLLAEGRAPEVRQALSDLTTAQPGALDDLLGRIARATIFWREPGDGPRQLAFLDLLVKTEAPPSTRLQTAVSEAISQRGGSDALEAMKQQLVAAFARPPLAAWLQVGRDDGLANDQDFDAAIEEARSGGDVDRTLRLEVEALLRQPADQAYGFRWQRAAALADWRERSVGGAHDPVLEALLADCDQLTHAQVGYWWGQNYLAAHRERLGDHTGARKVLEVALADRGMPEALRPQQVALLARSEESAGDDDAAIQTYSQLERLLPLAPSLTGDLLHTVFLNLNRGRTAEASRLLWVLSGADPATIRNSEGADQIRALLVLLKSGQATDFWGRSPPWWADWNVLAVQLGTSVMGVETSVPVIDSDSAWAARVGRAMQVNDRATIVSELKHTASAARWIPNAALNFGGMAVIMARVFPDKVDAYRHVCIGMLKAASDELGDPEGLRHRQALLCSLCLDGKDPVLAMRVVREYRDRRIVDDVTTRGVNIMWAMAAVATRLDAAEALAAVQADLATPLPHPPAGDVGLFRAREVLAEVMLLVALEKNEKIGPLVQRELAEPTIAASPAAAAMLQGVQQRLPALTAVEAAGHRSSPGQSSDAAAHVRQATELYDVNDFTGAESAANEALRLDPNLASAYAERGRARFSLRNLPGSIADYDQAIKLSPNYALAFNGRGFAKFWAGDPDGALADYDRALQLEPGQQITLDHRNEALRIMNAPDSPSDPAPIRETKLTRLIARDPTDSNAYLIRGCVRTYRQELPGAIADFDQAIAITGPRYFYAFAYRGVAKFQSGDLAGARADYDRAIAIDTHDAKVYSDRAALRQRQGDNVGAIGDFDRAIELSPENGQPYYDRGVAKAAQGDLLGAQADYEQARQHGYYH